MNRIQIYIFQRHKLYIMKTKKDSAGALIIICTGAIIAVLFFSYQNLNILNTNIFQAPRSFQYQSLSTANAGNYKLIESNTQNAANFNYAIDATSDNIVNPFPGKKLSEVAYQSTYAQPTNAFESNILNLISNAGTTKMGLILAVTMIIFCLLTEFFISFIKHLKETHYHHHRN